MALMNMLEFYTEDVSGHSELRHVASKVKVTRDDGYSVCPACGIEIIFEHNHPDFNNCPDCGSELVK